MELPLTIVALVILAIFSVGVIELFARYPLLVAIIVLAVSSLGALFAEDLLPLARFGPYVLYVEDFVFALVAGAAFARLVGMVGFRTGIVALIVVAVLALFAVVRGINVELSAAITEFRHPFYFLAAALYFASVPPETVLLGRISRAFIVAAGMILAVALIHWAALSLGIPEPSFVAPPYEGNFRVIHATRALVLAQAFFLVLATRRGRGSHTTFVHNWLAISLFVAVFLLQHRTVWVAFLAALAVAALRIRGLATRIAVVLVLGGALGSYLILGLFAGSEQPSLADSLSVQTSNVDTFFWRVEGWEALLRDQAAESADEIAIGTPYGTGFRRLVAGGEVTSSPHNFYISTYLRQGILGLAAFLLAYGYALVQLSRRAKRPGLGFADPDTMLVLLVSQLTFFIAYAPRMEQGLILGLAVALARAADSDKPPVVSASRYRGSPTTLRNRQPLGSLARKLDFLSDRRAAWKMDQKPAFPRTR